MVMTVLLFVSAVAADGGCGVRTLQKLLPQHVVRVGARSGTLGRLRDRHAHRRHGIMFLWWYIGVSAGYDDEKNKTSGCDSNQMLDSRRLNAGGPKPPSNPRNRSGLVFTNLLFTGEVLGKPIYIVLRKILSLLKKTSQDPQNSWIRK